MCFRNNLNFPYCLLLFLSKILVLEMIMCFYMYALLPDCLFQLFSGQKHFSRTITVILPSANMLGFLKELCLLIVISNSKSLIYLNVWGTDCSSQLYTSSTVKMAAYNIGKGYYKSFLKLWFFSVKNFWLHWLITIMKLWINMVWAGLKTI